MFFSRTGFDERNSGKTPLIGPQLGQIDKVIRLRRANGKGHSALVSAPGNILIVKQKATLWSVSLMGDVAWRRSLKIAHRVFDERVSAPLILSDGTMLLTGHSHLYQLDSRGKICYRLPLYFGPDDSGLSPNLTHDGRLLLTGPLGDFCSWDGTTLKTLHHSGYDLLPPPLYSDSSVLLHGYYATRGIQRLTLDGEELWHLDYRDADFPPVLNRQGFAAIGCLNTRESLLLGPQGELVGRYPEPALFSEYSEDSWIALSKSRIARISLQAEIEWEHRFAKDFNLGRDLNQALVDGEGRIYTMTASGLLALDARGGIQFELDLGRQPEAFTLIPGRQSALILGNRLLFIK